MKNLLLLSTLTLSLMFSAASSAEWTEVFESAEGDKHYVDFERIRKVNGPVYYWRIQDFLEPGPEGEMSIKVYSKAGCETMRVMPLSLSAYKLPIAVGTATGTWTPDPKWAYAAPDSVAEAELLAVCAH